MMAWDKEETGPTLSVLKQNFPDANYRYCFITEKTEHIVPGLSSLAVLVLVIFALRLFTKT